MTKVDLVYSQIYSLRNQIGVGPMIIFPTQTGMDIARYSDFPDKLINTS